MQIKKIIVDEIPKNCGECVFCDTMTDIGIEETYTGCKLNWTKVDEEDEPHDFCKDFWEGENK